jgi:hypothetical protein
MLISKYYIEDRLTWHIKSDLLTKTNIKIQITLKKY